VNIYSPAFLVASEYRHSIVPDALIGEESTISIVVSCQCWNKKRLETALCVLSNLQHGLGFKRWADQDARRPLGWSWSWNATASTAITIRLVLRVHHESRWWFYTRLWRCEFGTDEQKRIANSL